MAGSQSLLAQVLGSWDAAHCTITEPSITRSHCSPANPAVFSATSLHSALSAETDCHEMCVCFQHSCTPWAPTGTQQLSVGELEMLQGGTLAALPQTSICPVVSHSKAWSFFQQPGLASPYTRVQLEALCTTILTQTGFDVLRTSLSVKMSVHRPTLKMRFKFWYFLLKIAHTSYEFSGSISNAISPPSNHNLSFASLREAIICFNSQYKSGWAWKLLLTQIRKTCEQQVPDF